MITDRVWVEPLSRNPFRLREQASDMMKVVQDPANAEWLVRNRGGTVDRYQDRARALGSAFRAAWETDLKTGIVRQGQRARVAKGLTGVVPAITIQPPGTMKQFRGRLLDYWTGPGLSHAEHAQVVADMVGDHKGWVLAALSEGEEERALGIWHNLEPIGDRGRLKVVGADEHGLGNMPGLQVYLAHTEDLAAQLV